MLTARALTISALIVGTLLTVPGEQAQAADPSSDVAVAVGPSGDATQALADSIGTTHTAGVYLDRTNQRMAVAVTDEATAQKVRAAGAEANVVTYDAAYLSAIQNMLDAGFTIPGTSWGIDVLANQLAVTADSTVSDANYKVLQNAIAPYGSAARIERIAGTTVSAATTMAGGYYVKSGTTACTWGFSVRVKNQPSVQGFLTAGHCTVGARDAGYTGWVNGNGQYIGATAGGYFPGNDFGWVKRGTTSITFNGGVSTNTSGGIQDINTSRNVSLYEGVCSFGATSHYGCGLVTTKNQTVTYAGGQTVTGLDVINLCRAPGDSGGPVFSGKAAVGLLSGVNADGCRTFAQPVNEALAWYGLEVY
jgi:hypothetical protein